MNQGTNVESGKPDQIAQPQGKSTSLSSALPQAEQDQLIVLFNAGRHAEVESRARLACGRHPGSGFAWKALGASLQVQGKDDLAVLQKATALLPDDAEAHSNLGNALKALGQLDGAVASFRRALEIQPDFAEAHNNLGNVLRDLRQLDGAVVHFRRALEIKPDYAEAHNSLGTALKELGQFDGAVASYAQALEIKPDYAGAHNNLGTTLQDLGRFDDAVASFCRALEFKPDYVEAHNNLLFTLNYHPDKSGEEIFAAYREYDQRFGLPCRSKWRPHGNDRQANRCLKVGYVSPDFRLHSCRYFLEPLLAHHDKTQVEVYAYAELALEDAVTARYRSYADHWVPTLGMSDDALAERIRADGIDILVDLAGHTAKNRLAVFARKPAPVSLSWLGFGYTTGLTAMDYLLTDAASAPAGSENLFSETPWRLATPGYAYRPAEGMGEVSPLPALTRGHITFGTLTRAVRLNQRVIRVWSEILKRVEGSRLVIDSSNFREAAMQDALAEKFAACGVSRERLEIGYRSPPWELLRGLDIGLDCFPHNSGTTLFETLYMGVPFVTLAGRPGVGRLGSSVLEGAGHPSLIAGSEEEYIEKTVALASDLPQLAALRGGLRGEMEAGPLMDEVGFARKVETAYREMWAKWCGEETGEGTVERTPALPPAKCDQLIALFNAGCYAEAESRARLACEQYPDSGLVWKILGASLRRQGKDALQALQKAASFLPDDAETHYSLGNALKESGDVGGAVASYAQALEIDPDFSDVCHAHYSLGNALKDFGQLDGAVASFRRALEIKPDHAEAHCNLGVVLQELGQINDAAASYAQALEIKPDFVEAHSNLGIALQHLGQLDDAVASYARALEIKPDFTEAHSNLGLAQLDLGQLDGAVASFHRALGIKPDYVEAHNNLLFALNYHPDKSSEEIFAAYREYDQRFGLPCRSKWRPHGNDRQANRRLKVGYVSPDFRFHSCGHFLEPLLAHHDKAQVEVYAYAELALEDAVTARYRGYVDHWIPTLGMSDDALSDRIRADGIDILVDLAGHTAKNRLSVFARKPAPVSLSWLGFGYTTGLTAMDYLLTDAASAPAGSENLFSETPWHLATPGYVYRPAEGMGQVSPLPALTRGHITFGTLTRSVRLNYRVIRVWSEILKRVEGARLVIDSRNFQSASMQDALAEKFAAHGITRDRLEIGYHSPPWEVLRSLDIGLDCFPHNSGTTLFETLYLGVPFVTLAGRPSVGRLGSSVLEGAGHPSLIARSEDEYVEIAVSLASDLSQLTSLRGGLRREMETGPLMDEAGFARKVEAAYREMWAKWCGEKTADRTPALPPAESDQLVALFSAGRHAEVESRARSLIEQYPDSGFAWKVLGASLQEQGKNALVALQMATELLPDDAEAHNNLGNALTDLEQLDAAVASYRRALEINPGYADAHSNLGNTLQALGLYDNALASYAQALEIKPDFAEAYNNLGNVLKDLERLDGAVASYAQALEIKPDYAEAHNNLGNVLKDLGQLNGAVASYQHALEIKSDFAEAHNNLGNVLKDLGQLDGAVASYQHALESKADYACAHNNLGNALKDLGRLDDAVASYRRALEIKPDYVKAHNNLLFALNYHPDKSGEAIFAIYQEYDQRFGLPHRGKWRPHGNSREVHRRLKVGYVSPDFRLHPCRHFLEPLLAHHDKNQVVVYAYAELAREDAVTSRYRGYVDHWLPTRGMSDDALSERIRADGIDILVDLAGHTDKNRLAVFARKPAPVSLSWLGFGYSTGLTAVDYLLTDAVAAPAGSEGLFSETPWRLETPGYVYRPAEGMGEVSPLPALTRGHVTFGTLTRSERINHRTIRVWSEILKRVEGARLVIDSGNYRSVAMQDALATKFAAHGVTRNRLEIGYRSPPWEVLRGLDIGLDCFPHNSGTTLFETLYMGVPFVTLAGRPSVGRLGSSVLEGAGHPSLIAHTEEEYIEKAVALASNLPKLAALRGGLRKEMETGPLMDEAGFARKVEAAYREMWVKWCGEETADRTPALPPAERDRLIALFNAGRHAEAESRAHLACGQYPDSGVAWVLLGTSLHMQGKNGLPALQKATELSPFDAMTHYNLGNALKDLEQFDAAAASYRRALEIKPDYVEAHFNLGFSLQALGQLDGAVVSYAQVLEIKPDYVEAYSNLGIIQQALGHLDDAVAIYAQALKIKPDYVIAHNNLGSALHDLGQLDGAVASYAQALEIKPDFAEVHSNLGKVLKDLGQFDDAVACYAQALEFKPDYVDAYDNLLFTLNYHPSIRGEEIFAVYREYDEHFGLPHRSKWRPHDNSREARRRLKVGYVSPDFRRHSCRHFLEPLLAHHDKTQVEVYAYAELALEDEVTARYQGYVDHWVPTAGMTDDALSDRIRADGIDILIDLAGHTGKNRLSVFARKPAPVSLSWLGFGYTTGLTAMDYLLTDAASAPAGSESLFSEIPWRLATPGYVYRPAEGMGEVSPLPALTRGHITFGTLTRSVRLNHRVIRVWSEILKRVEGSRLVIDSSSFREATMQDALAEKFAAHGVVRDRLEIGCHSPPWEVLRGLDIGLDCFPHNSGTTLFETLYMGVPFVTLAGRPSVGLLGSSVLEGVGHPEWIARSEDEYVEKAVALASNLPQLAALRGGLRREMETGSLMDEAGFARKVEAAYREMWGKWCGNGEELPDRMHQAQTKAHGMPLPKLLKAGKIAAKKGKSSSKSASSPESLPQAERNQLVALFNTGRYAEMESRARLACERYPGSGFAWKGLSVSLQMQGKNALAALQKTTELLPDDADAHSNLGNALRSLGRLDEAVTSYRRALEIKPDFAVAHNNLGNAMRNLGRLDQAAASYRQALEIKPDFVEAHSNLGNVLQMLGQLDAAAATCRRALEIKPDYAEAHNNLGAVLQARGQFDSAVASYGRALEIKPDYAEAYNNLGNALKDLGQLDGAVENYRRALAINPDFAEAHSNLGNALQELGQFDGAATSCRRALEINPDFAEAHNNLGSALYELGQLDGAVASYAQALELEPDYAVAHCNLGLVMQCLGQFDNAVASYRRALEIKPDFTEAHNNLLFALNYHPSIRGEEIFSVYREYDQRFGLPLREKWRPHDNSREAHRRLKVGYVSPDFRRHSCRHFLEPLLSHHDKTQVEVYAYAELVLEDAVTARYRGYVDHWLPTIGMSDDALSEHIRADGIDILVDLAGHTAKNRLSVFARKPAPVSLSWLGFGYTTGLTAMDYLLTDAASAPAGSENLFSETPWRLATPGYVYRPTEGMGEVSPLPALTRGHITFGTLTRAVRLNYRVIRVWSEILKRVEGSRLVIDSSNFLDATMQDALAEKFAAHGITRDRLEIGCHSPPWEVLRSLDIGLDCFPHNSGTTLFETLYMGVPFVTLAGRPSVGRLGSSVLEGAGHLSLIAHTEEEYIEKAVALASNLPELVALRDGLRHEMETGPLMDEAGFARKVEAAYREMWGKWCGNGQAGANAGETADRTLSLPEAERNQLVALFNAGRYAEMESRARLACERYPDSGFAWVLLGASLQMQGKEGIPALQKVAELMPDDALAHYNLGNALRDRGRFEGAVASYAQALEINPGYAEAHSNLGNALQALGQLDGAARSYVQALEIKPDNAEAHNNLAVILQAFGRLDDAVASYRRALEIKPDYAEAHSNLSVALKNCGQLDAAVASCRRALEIKPDYAAAYSNLGLVLQSLGQLDGAVASHAQALAIEPDNFKYHSNLLLTLLYDDKLTPAEMFAESRKFGEHLEALLKPAWPRHTHLRDAERRLKIGYVSADLRDHAIAYFIEPILANHDKAGFEVYCYHSHPQQDAVTARLRGLADHWRQCDRMDDEQLSAQIQADGIDILVDLSGHTAGNRLPVFARKPAPLQVTWMGYCGTTGLTAMDYRLTDAHLDPPGLTDAFHTEKLVRLSASAVFRPDMGAPPVNRLPALDGKPFTFACLNNPSKLNEKVIALWSRILKAVPMARMMLGNAHAKQEEWRRDLFAKYGVAPERLLLQPRVGMDEYLALHGQIDLALDPFPYNGGTTSLHALWMGVPVVTLAGDRTVSRVGVGVLGNAGLPQFVAQDEDGYAQCAIRMTHELNELDAIRQGLRARMLANEKSPSAYTRELEAVYRTLWRDWCERGK